MSINRSEPSKAMNRVVEAGNFVFIGGTTASDKSKDITGQAHEIFAKFDALLAVADVDKNSIVAANVYMIDLADKPAFSEAWSRWIAAENLPARVVVGVAQLGQGTLVEITLTAYKS